MCIVRENFQLRANGWFLPKLHNKLRKKKICIFYVDIYIKMGQNSANYPIEQAKYGLLLVKPAIRNLTWNSNPCFSRQYSLIFGYTNSIKVFLSINISVNVELVKILTTLELTPGKSVNNKNRCSNMDIWQTPLPPAFSTWFMNYP